MSQAEDVFAETFVNTLKGWSLVHSFRQVAAVGASHVVPQIERGWMEALNEFDAEGVFEKILVPPDGATQGVKEKFFEVAGGLPAMAQKMASGQMADHSYATDAASLVFAHSIVDSAAYDCCRTTGLISPDDWESAVEKKTFTLKDIKGEAYETLRERKLEKYFLRLERKSLLHKLAALRRVCKPPAGFSNMKGYSYDEGRISELDTLRHKVVHGGRVVQPLPNGDADIWYLLQTSMHLMILVNHRFGITIDEVHFKRAMMQAQGDGLRSC